MRRLTRINWIAALVLLVISISANADDWITHYYEHPTPERFVAEVQAMSKSGHLANAESAASIAAFLGRVMAANPSQIEGWLNQLGGLKGNDRDTLLLAANLSQSKEALAYIRRQPDGNKYQEATDIRTVEPNDAFILDMLWGDFFATGEATPIRRIVHALNYGKYAGALDKYKASNKTEQDRNVAVLETVFEAARWSLEANIRQHHRVAEIVEQIFWKEKITDEERTWLTAVLVKSFPEKYEVTQVKPGEWVFKRKLHMLTPLAAEPPSSVLGADGKLDVALISAFVKWAEPSIREYPPRFKDNQHQRQVTEATECIVKELNTADLSAVMDQSLLVDIAQTFAMAHNLDMGTGPKAKSIFEQAIALNPNDRRANYLFGMFLISTRAHHFDSLPYLEKAYALGEKDALFSLGLLWVHKGEKNKGLEMLEAYASDHPESVHTHRVIQAIKDGKLEFKRK